MPCVIENNLIPDIKHECADPSILRKHPSLKNFAGKFPPIDEEASVCLLICRNAGDLLSTKTHTKKAPVVYKTPLGWAIVGSTCPQENFKPRSVNITALRTTLDHDHFTVSDEFTKVQRDVFATFPDDEEPGASVDDKKFMNIIENNIRINKEGNLEAQLPLKDENFIFPDNSKCVFNRQQNTLKNLEKNLVKKEGCFKFMDKMISSSHVEKVPQPELQRDDGKIWYLPIFPVMHPKKKKWRLVFDSASTFYSVP